MTDLAALPASASRTLPRVASRESHLVWLCGTFVVAAFAGAAVGHARAAGPAGFEPALALLLRFMAVCKAAMALGAAALLAWRLRQPLAPRAFAFYLAALAPMAAAPGLIWSLGLVAPGALLFHAGLLAFLVLAVRDDGAPLGWKRRGA